MVIQRVVKMYPEDSVDNWISGQGVFGNVPKDKWDSWSWQLANSIKDKSTLSRFLDLTEEEVSGIEYSGKKLLFSVTPYFFNLIDRDNVNCPIRKQVIPRKNEMIVSPDEILDPVGEEPHTPVPGLVHKYPDRVLFLVTSFCGSYCRYCTRSRLVSDAQGYDFHPNYKGALEYIRGNTNIRDVLLSGGDPLMLPDRKLDKILMELRNIKHVEFIRIGSRIPVFAPQRITPGLCEVLEKHGPIWMSVHVNHPKECTVEFKEACQKLLSARVVLGNQSVLLNGVNDDPDVMKSLCHRLLQIGIKPYYLYQCDLITGSAHFRTNVLKGIEIIQHLRGHTTGYGIPQLVIDVPGGGGKIPLNPDTVKEITEDEIVLHNYQGKEYRYPLNPKVSNKLNLVGK